MPPKKSTKKATSKKGDGKNSTSQSKKGTKGKKKKTVHEGPIDWKLSKERLEELRALNLVSSKIKSQITVDLEPLTKAFAPRDPFKHWTLKSPEIPLLGIASADACGVLCKTEPLYPVIDVADRRAIARCWRAIRLHFEPIGPPVGVEEEEEEYDIFAGGGDSSPSSRIGTAASGRGGGGDSLFGGSPSGSRGGSRGASRGEGSLNSVEGWVGPMTLYGMSRWLNHRGEKFPGSGFPYDEVVWKPLEVLILKHFRKTKDGFLKAKWKQPSFNPLSCFKPNSTANFQTQVLTNAGEVGSGSGGGMFPQLSQHGVTGRREDSLDFEDDEDDDDEDGGKKVRKTEPPPWSSRSALISSLTNESELVKLKHETEIPNLSATPPGSVPSTARSTSNGATGGGKKKKKGKNSTGGTTTPPTPGISGGTNPKEVAAALALTPEEEEELKEEFQAKLLAAGPEIGRVIAKINDSDHPAHLNLSDAAGNFAIAIAAERGLTQAVFMLAKAGCYVDAPGQAGNTALHLAASSGCVDVVKALIAAGADSGAQNAYGESALHLASRYGHADVVKLLVGAGAPVSSWTAGHHSPIHFAAGAGHLPCLKLLDKAAASEGKTKGKKGATKGSKTKKDASSSSGAAPSTAPAVLGAPIEKATLNSLTHGMEPPILRTVTALGGRAACHDAEVLKDPNNAGLSATLQYLGGKFKDPLAVKPAKSGAAKAGTKKKK